MKHTVITLWSQFTETDRHNIMWSVHTRILFLLQVDILVIAMIHVVQFSAVHTRAYMYSFWSPQNISVFNFNLSSQWLLLVHIIQLSLDPSIVHTLTVIRYETIILIITYEN